MKDLVKFKRSKNHVKIERNSSISKSDNSNLLTFCLNILSCTKFQEFSTLIKSQNKFIS